MSDDVAAIHALIGSYAERLDAGDLDGVAALFEHGTFRSAWGGPPRVGQDAVRAMYEPVVIYADGTPRTLHVIGNVDVTVDGRAGTATARCTFTVLQAVDGVALRPVLVGRYHDELVRVGGAWRFALRTVHPDLAGDLSHHMDRGRRG